MNAAKTAEPIEMQFVMLSWVGQWDHVLDEGAYWRHLVNTIEPSMFGGDGVCLSNYFDRLFSVH